MKKLWKSLICSVLLVAMIISLAACGGNNDLQGKYDDLQARLEQQEEKLGQQDEKLKQQEERIKELQEKDKALESKNQELERKNNELEEINRELEKSINELTGAIPYELGVFGSNSSAPRRHDLCGKAALLRSKLELGYHLMIFDNQYRPVDFDDHYSWSMRYGGGRFDYDGTYFDEDTILEWYDESFFSSKALIFCFFYSPNISARLENHRVCIDNSTLQVKIEFSCGDATAVEYAMVLLEVNQSDVRNITEVHLETKDIER